MFRISFITLFFNTGNNMNRYNQWEQFGPRFASHCQGVKWFDTLNQPLCMLCLFILHFIIVFLTWGDQPQSVISQMKEGKFLNKFIVTIIDIRLQQCTCYAWFNNRVSYILRYSMPGIHAVTYHIQWSVPYNKPFK